ncbi:MAG TPA: hypothetical protein VG095_10190 [Chthoniobacterales bacterium]|nr:hypothetical protein [Chthoniobacterales bacterium]
MVVVVAVVVVARLRRRARGAREQGAAAAVARCLRQRARSWPRLHVRAGRGVMAPSAIKLPENRLVVARAEPQLDVVDALDGAATD